MGTCTHIYKASFWSEEYAGESNKWLENRAGREIFKVLIHLNVLQSTLKRNKYQSKMEKLTWAWTLCSRVCTEGTLRISDRKAHGLYGTGT